MLTVSATVLIMARTVGAASVVVARTGNASIAHDSDAGTWALAAAGTTLTLAVDRGDFQVIDLTTVNKRSWIPSPAADATVTIDGRAAPFGSRAFGFTLAAAEASQDGAHLRFDVVYDQADSGLRITRHYQLTSMVPAFETWMTYATRRTTTINNLNALQLTIPSGALHYVTGLMGDDADVDHTNAFTRRTKTLAAGDHFAIGATGRASETAIPWVSVDGTAEHFFVALLWSGAWSLAIDSGGNSLTLNLGLRQMATTVNTAIEGPHVLIGVVRGGVAQASAAARDFIVQGERAGNTVTPWVTYNTWFAYGTDIDEASMEAEMTRAAALGVELFVMDAGWYVGAGASGPFDFDAGLGSWTPDPARFPNGFRALTDYAHSLGLKFGIWVEPERVNLSVVGESGPQESWLATTGGTYGSDHAGQICLASTAARAYLFQQLSALIDTAQPDYLKWDNNMWINCDRGGHGHGSTDGNFAHVSGLYDLLGQLRAKYPSLLIENVSGGGNRLDFGMMQYTDAAWMDDRTAPSVHVRHNIEGLSEIFPPAYLLSFVTDHSTESIDSPADLSLYMRSRMPGALGLCFLTKDLSDGDMSSIAAQIAVYKTLRNAIASASGVLIGLQATETQPPAWDVLQETTESAAQIIIWAYQSDPASPKVNVKPSGLSATTLYQVRSTDLGVLGTSKGADLTANGIDILGTSASAAHVLIITPR